jgi:NADH-quinone oxidoreductase subunit C
VLPEALANELALRMLDERYSSSIREISNSLDQITVVIDPVAISDLALFLKHELGFDRLSSVTAVDWWPVTPRFEVVYHLHSIKNNKRLRLKAQLSEGQELDSVTPVWKTANWYEREVFDLFGIPFRNHPNLERIMMPADWEGHPLRKDYPVHGHKYSYADET